MRVLRGDVTELLLCIVNSLWQDREGAPWWWNGSITTNQFEGQLCKLTSQKGIIPHYVSINKGVYVEPNPVSKQAI